jgi:predicted O-methyltransferase YrrM
VPQPDSLPADLLAQARAAKGFMPEDEGALLHRWARERLPHGPALEVGTYCGKSAIWLGGAARVVGGTVFTVDHHRGSEENQAGWEHHDSTLVDPDLGIMDTLPTFRRTIADAGLEEHVVAVVGRSETVGRWWRTPLSLLFIDGGHGVEPARADFRTWPRWVMADGVLLVHDVFPDPADGGRPPYEDIYLPAIASGAFIVVDAVGSMRVLRRTTGDAGDPIG